MRKFACNMAFAVILCFVAVTCYSCQKDDAYLKADNHKVSFPANPSEAVRVNIDSHAEWTYFTSQSWIRVQKFDDHMIVTALENDGDKRDGYIGITTSRKGIIVEVEQAGIQAD